MNIEKKQSAMSYHSDMYFSPQKQLSQMGEQFAKEFNVATVSTQVSPFASPMLESKNIISEQSPICGDGSTTDYTAQQKRIVNDEKAGSDQINRSFYSPATSTPDTYPYQLPDTTDKSD